MASNLIPLFPSPRDNLAKSKFQFGYVWKHDVETEEFRHLGNAAKVAYFSLATLVDNGSQSIAIGRTKLGKIIGMERGNVKAAIQDLEKAGLLAVKVHSHTYARKADGKVVTVHGSHLYTLLCAPSALVTPPPEDGAPVQMALPFRRLNWPDAKALRARARARG